MGDFLAGALGTKSQYQANAAQAGNPYDQSYLQNAVDNQQQIYANQQALALQLQKNMAGVGPNPAQTQYEQNAQQNINNAQGLIASQRGLNPALATRLGANAATNANQQAAGQASILQQNQQLGATQALSNLYGQQQQGNIGQQQLYVAPNTAAMQTNASVANANQQNAAGIVGGLLGAAGSGATMFKAQGGEIAPQRFDMGGAVSSLSSGFGPQSQAGGYLNQGFGPLGGLGGSGGAALQKGFSSFGVKAPSLPGSSTTPNSITGGSLAAGEEGAPLAGGAADVIAEAGPLAALAAKGGMMGKNFKPGGKVPGKASVAGDSYANDTVPAIVSPGEIVLPRSVTQAKDAPKKAAAFVQAILAKKQGKMK